MTVTWRESAQRGTWLAELNGTVLAVTLAGGGPLAARRGERAGAGSEDPS